MDSVELEALREKYKLERPKYQKFAEYVKELLEKKTRQDKLICSIEARAKEIDSFVKKALLKKYNYEQINDKAGVRLIVTYEEDLSALEEIVSHLFDVINYENKLDNLNSYELGYTGIHFEVRLSKPIPEQYHDMICEVQLHTQARNLWSTVSHKLLYKPSEPLPTNIQRDIYHLSAITGIFDHVVKNVRKDIFARSLEAKILSLLEKNFYRFNANQSFNRELSIEIIQKLQELLTKEEQENFETILNEFVARNESKLEDTFEYYSEDDRLGLLLSQPESLFILERLEKDKFLLRDAWCDILPFSMLQDLASAWGKPYQDEF
jgi:ppGpp synthetase/RelA/SpoT-type nucleotidyltranferase